MYKCNHCNITFSSKDDEGILTFRGKMYCKKCEEPVVEILDTSQAASSIHGAQATLISNSDNRITTNNYYGSGTPDEQIDTPYGPCRKSEARLCRKCRQWVPVSFFNEEKKLCDDCVSKEVQKYVEDGKRYFDMGFYNDAIRCFQDCELICSDENELLNLKSLIGRSYYELKDYSQALKYFIAASRNNTESIYYIAICYLNGTGVAKDESKAFDLLKKSANMGNQKAIDFLLEKQRYEERKKMLETMELHPIEEKGKYGYADDNGNVVIPCKWKYAGFFHEGLALVKDDNNKYGFIDKTGNVIIPCKWEYTHDFHEGLALVNDDNDKYGFIDKTGNVVIPCKWKYAKSWFREGLAYVKDDNDKYGFIDKTGNLVIPCKWKDAASLFNEGLAYVKDNNNKYGFIDKTGDVVLPCKWKDAGFFHEGLARVMDDNDKYGFIDKTGDVVFPCKWKDAALLFNEGLAYVKDDNYKYGFIDKTGNVVIPCKWRWGTSNFHEGLACVKDDNYKYGFIDKTGAVIIPCKWSEARDFNNGKARVKGEDGKWVSITKNGEVI